MEQIVIAGVEQGQGSYSSGGYYSKEGGIRILKKCREIRISSIFFLFSGLDQGADDTYSAILTNCHTFRIILVITLSSKYTNCTKYCDAGGGSPLSRYYRGLSRYYCRCRELPSRYNCHLSLLMKNVKASPILERSIQGREGHPLHLSELCATPGQPNKNHVIIVQGCFEF